VVIELRQFAGLGHKEIAVALGFTVYLASQEWAYAGAWLSDALGDWTVLRVKSTA
jgi:ECF sigma factor